MVKNEQGKVRLAALKLPDGKADTIAKGLERVLDEFRLWGSIQMIVADTTSVNTGRKNGVVSRLQRMFRSKGHPAPQFIGCQHHILDRILRVVMDAELHGSTKSPNIEYFFMKDLISTYDDLKKAFKNGSHIIQDEGGWRDDMKFLFHLTRVFRYHCESNEFPFVKFQKLPNLSNARWNSRAILVLLAFILMPSTRSRVHTVCTLIAYKWADHWFSDQTYRREDYEELSDMLQPRKV